MSPVVWTRLKRSLIAVAYSMESRRLAAPDQKRRPESRLFLFRQGLFKLGRLCGQRIETLPSDKSVHFLAGFVENGPVRYGPTFEVWTVLLVFGRGLLIDIDVNDFEIFVAGLKLSQAGFGLPAGTSPVCPKIDKSGLGASPTDLSHPLLLGLSCHDSLTGIDIDGSYLWAMYHFETGFFKSR